ncbi:MAG: anion transporter [Kofleriaceae bacterium]|nr:anion transporter [Kofleriaceae bacterium]
MADQAAGPTHHIVGSGRGIVKANWRIPGALSTTAALIIFALSFAALTAAGVPRLALDRPAIALIGAVLMVAVAGFGTDAALQAIDLRVIALLFGTMVIAAYLDYAQFFRYAAYVVLTRADSARALLWGIVMLSGVLSAFLLNDTVCLVLTPLVVAVTRESKLPTLPFILAVSSAANIGGIASLTGNPQNMLIAQKAGGLLRYGPYLALGAPLAILCLCANAALLTVLFRRILPHGPLAARRPPKPAFDRVLTVKALLALLAFAIMSAAGVSLTGASMVAVAALIVVAGIAPKKALALVDWPLLVFFAGLFVIIAAVNASGVLQQALDIIGPTLRQGGGIAALMFVGVVVLGSNIVSNVPFVLVFLAVVPALPHPATSYVQLALVSTLAGNLTPMGSIANIITLEKAGPLGRITFPTFVGYGLAITAVSLVVAGAGYALAVATGFAGALGLAP